MKTKDASVSGPMKTNQYNGFQDNDDDGTVFAGIPKSDRLSSKEPRHSSPLVVAMKSPGTSPNLQPMQDMLQAVPIEEVDFEMLEEATLPMGQLGFDSQSMPRSARFDVGDATTGSTGATAYAQSSPGLGGKPAYVVPTTPSPFLNSSFPPSSGVVPPFESVSSLNGSDLGDSAAALAAGVLPPTFSENNENSFGGVGGFCGGELTSEQMSLFAGMFGGCSDQYGMPLPPFMPHNPWAMIGGCGPGDMAYYEGMQRYLQDNGLMVPPAMNSDDGDDDDDQVNGDDHHHGAAPKDIGGAQQPQSQQSSHHNQYGNSQHQQQQHHGTKDTSGRRGKGSRGGRDQQGDGGGKGGGSNGNSAVGSNGGGHYQSNGYNSSGYDKVGGEKNIGRQQQEEHNIPPGEYTTVMLRNIPNKYTREMLVDQLSINFAGLFDFMYLPIDFKNRCNVGYGFINFRNQEACETFVSSFHGMDVRKCLPGLNSKKIVEVTPARVQGVQENVRRLRNSPVMNQLEGHPEWMPLLFSEDGHQIPFPSPDGPLPPVKSRGRNREARAAAAAAAAANE